MSTMTPSISFSRRAWAHAMTHIKDKDLVIASIISIVLLCASLYVSYFASVYASKSASNYVTDIILSNIPVIDVDWIFMYGPLVMWCVVTALLFYRPKFFPFTLKSISLFILVRAIFLSLTHIGPFPNHLVMDQESLINFFTSDSDLFFSAHTGLPFLMALIFWHSRAWRYLFMVTAVFFGVIVLVAHVHYSIDVAGAFFITYSIHRLAQLAFKKDWDRTKHAGVWG
ncbi:MAG: hypothetical protein V4481_03060 [Patescibacteria group bacterium]